MTVTGLALLASAATALAAAQLVWRVAPPSPPLRRLLHRPPADERAGERATPGMAGSLSRHLPAGFAGPETRRLLRHAGLARGHGVEHALAVHLSRQVAMALLHGLAFGVAVTSAGQSPSRGLAAALLGAAAGAARERGRVQRLVERRRQSLRVELYTVNQLLALDVRAGGGVAQALGRLTRRSHGAVAEELRDVLAAMRGGTAVSEALEQAAVATPEPAAARTYRLLAKGVQYGADLASGLRALSEDLRVERAETLERTATRRRAAMLVPIIGLLAPVMLLFIAAPLPSIVFGDG